MPKWRDLFLKHQRQSIKESDKASLLEEEQDLDNGHKVLSEELLGRQGGWTRALGTRTGLIPGSTEAMAQASTGPGNQMSQQRM